MVADNIKRMAETAVLLPIVNLVAATTLLASYAVGFGSNVGWYFSLDDVFAASLIGLMPFYIAVAYWVIMEVRLSLVRAGNPLNHLPVYGPFDRKVKLAFWRRLAKLAVVFSALMTIIAAMISHWVGRPVDVFAVFTAVSAVVIVFVIEKSLSAQWPINDPPFLVGVAIITILVLMAVSAKGMNDGQRDRFLSYNEAKSSRAQCGKYVVIRKSGSMYLAIGEDDRHRLINDDCMEKILIPAISPKGKMSDLPLPLQRLLDVSVSLDR